MIQAFVVALAVATLTPQPSADFRNFTYHVHPCASNVPTAAVIRGGTFSYFDTAMGQGFDISVSSIRAGSLRIGTRQVAVILSCEFPIGGTATAYLFDTLGNTATLLGEVAEANWGADWGRGPDSIHVRFADNRLYVEACANNECDMTGLSTYALRGSKLVKVNVKTYSTTKP